MKKLLSGNEAIARGAHEAGVLLAAAYPGTPSTEILENILQYKEIYAQWSPNEKSALEVAIGGAIAGARSLAIMKHVGVNVAADPLLSFSYTGLNKGLVIITADDPSMHSSQNEQDNRNYAKFAKIPLLEPSDSFEAKEFLKIAFEISEKFDTPVLLRTTTRISHSKSIVEIGKAKKTKPPLTLTKNPKKFVMLPANARLRRIALEDRMKELIQFAENFKFNKEEINDKKIGIITSSASYQYAKKVAPNASFLKLAMSYPLCTKKIKAFSQKVKELFVIEELDPFFEDQIKALGIKVKGKEIFPTYGEFDPLLIEDKLFNKKTKEKPALLEYIPPRPPNMCPGCPHRPVFYTLKKEKCFVCGDIGCYTLGAIPPLAAMHSCVCMGASIGNALGISKALDKASKEKCVAVIGDSTFMHSGITGLLDMVYNNAASTLIILDNRITAMTGRQENPASGYTAKGDVAKILDFKKLALALNVDKKNIKEVNPYDLENLQKVIKAETKKKSLSVIIVKALCVLLKRDKMLTGEALTINEEKCTGCKSCLQISCPAINWNSKKGKKGMAQIDSELCNGCDICAQICKFDAIG